MGITEAAIMAIEDKYHSCENTKIDENYLKLYSIKSIPTNTKEEILHIFAKYQDDLNLLLSSWNSRVSGNRHYISAESNQLICLIDSICELQKLCQKTEFSFWIDRDYYTYVIKIRPILKSSNGTEIPMGFKPIPIKRYTAIFSLLFKSKQEVEPENNIRDILRIVSTRSATFEEMVADEKLCCINQVIEHLLKHGNEYIEFSKYKDVFLGLLTEQQIIDYRKATHCFRHGKDSDIKKRNEINDMQKAFLINFGISICNALIGLKNSHDTLQI